MWKIENKCGNEHFQFHFYKKKLFAFLFCGQVSQKEQSHDSNWNVTSFIQRWRKKCKMIYLTFKIFISNQIKVAFSVFRLFRFHKKKFLRHVLMAMLVPRIRTIFPHFLNSYDVIWRKLSSFTLISENSITVFVAREAWALVLKGFWVSMGYETFKLCKE